METTKYWDSSKGEYVYTTTSTLKCGAKVHRDNEAMKKLRKQQTLQKAFKDLLDAMKLENGEGGKK